MKKGFLLIFSKGLSLLLLLIEFSPTRRMTAENALKNIYFNKFTPQSSKPVELTTLNSKEALPSPASPMDKYKYEIIRDFIFDQITGWIQFP